MNIKKLKIARKKIDQLDTKIFNLIKKRTIIVNHMLALKQFKKQIVDRKRINQILKKIRKKHANGQYYDMKMCQKCYLPHSD